MPSGVVQDPNVPTNVLNTPSLRQYVAITACDRSPNGYTAKGTANNPTKAEKPYTITVFFTTNRGTVIGTGAIKVSVLPGQTQKWQIDGQLTPAPGTECVLRGVG